MLMQEARRRPNGGIMMMGGNATTAAGRAPSRSGNVPPGTLPARRAPGHAGHAERPGKRCWKSATQMVTPSMAARRLEPPSARDGRMGWSITGTVNRRHRRPSGNAPTGRFRCRRPASSMPRRAAFGPGGARRHRRRPHRAARGRRALSRTGGPRGATTGASAWCPCSAPGRAGSPRPSSRMAWDRQKRSCTTAAINRRHADRDEERPKHAHRRAGRRLESRDHRQAGQPRPTTKARRLSTARVIRVFADESGRNGRT